MDVTAQLLSTAEDYHSFNPGRPQLLPYPTALEFSKQVNRGLPCVYAVLPTRAEGVENIIPSGLANHTPRKSRDAELQAVQSLPAFSWTQAALLQHVQDDVDVAVTPDGRADALCTVGVQKETVFLQPATASMSLKRLLEELCSPMPRDAGPAPVYYLQSQNSNLTSTPLSSLLADLPENFPFAEEVLGGPDAINIWIGNEQSVTSTHRDPYENLYLVLRGGKTFTLWAPVDEVTMNAQMVRTGHYIYHSAADPPSFSVVLDDDSPDAERIPWVPIDPHKARSILDTDHPLYRFARPQTVTVAEGQMLYLPAGWFHHVSQECGVWDDGSAAPCIAVNYWYDQDYEGEKYVMRQLVTRLVEQSRLEEAHRTQSPHFLGV